MFLMSPATPVPTILQPRLIARDINFEIPFPIPFVLL